MDAEQYDEEFRRKGRDTRNLGNALLFLGGMAWLWFAGMLLLPYEAGDTSPTQCEAPLFTDRDLLSEDGDCGEERRWPVVVGIGGVASALSLAGTGLCVYGHLKLNVSRYREAMRELPGSKEEGTS